jgi:mRNA interferase MazF
MANAQTGPKPKRGDIYWVNLDPTVGAEIKKTRPCVVMSLDVLNAQRHTVVVVPLSSVGTPRPPLVIAIPSAGAGHTARIDQIRVVDKTRLSNQRGRLDQGDLTSIENSLRTVLGL